MIVTEMIEKLQEIVDEGQGNRDVEAVVDGGMVMEIMSVELGSFEVYLITDPM